jgi:hypothetical protein
LQIARKAAVSLLICVLLFAGFCVFAFTSLFNIIETRFYDSAVLNGLTDELAEDTSFIDSYISDLQKRFSEVLLEDAVRRSFWVNQSNEDIYERSRIFASLGVSLPGLQWVRFIDISGNRLHYSTSPDDQIITNDGTVLYKNYPEVTGYLPFDQQMLSGIATRRILFDGENERLIFYYPFYDSMDIRRGEALFSLSIRAFNERLAENRQIKMSDNVSVIPGPDGIVIGIPPLEMASVKKAIASVWAAGGTAISHIYVPQSETLVLLSEKTSQGIFVGHIVPENLFAVPFALKVLLVAAAFITMFVVIFLVLNAKPDAVAVVQSRLKELQVSLMHEYYQLMGDMDWAVWRRELEQRREDVRDELCRGIKIKKGSGIEEYINSFFNRSWDSLLAAIGSRTGMITTFDETKLEAILNRVLSSTKPSHAGQDYDFKGYGQNDEFEESRDDGNDILDDGPVAGIGERYDDIGELESAEEGPETETSGVTGERYDYTEALGPVEDGPMTKAPAVPMERYDDIEEFEPVEDGPEAQAARTESHGEIEELEAADEPESSGPGQKEEGFLPEDISEIGGDEAAGAAAEDVAWLNLAVEAAAMEPTEIWAELSDADKVAETAEPAETPETTEASGRFGPGKEPPLLDSYILEQDPFEEDASSKAGENVPYAHSGAAEAGIPGYGEFIPAAQDLTGGASGIDPLYNVEEFDDADNVDADIYHQTPKEDHPSYPLIHPGKELNIDEIASQIEFAANDTQRAPPQDDFDLDVRSPLDEIFTEKMTNKPRRNARTSPLSAGKPGKKPPAAPPSKPLEAASRAPLSQPQYRFFSQKSGDLEYIEAVDDENETSLIKKRNGVDYIDSALLKKNSADTEKIDPKMKRLVDSVLRNR